MTDLFENTNNDSSKHDKENQAGNFDIVVSGQILYEALHCPCRYESASYTISIHATELGAKRKIREHKLKEYKKWREMYEVDKLAKLHKQFKNRDFVYSDEYSRLLCRVQDSKFGWNMWWGVSEIIVEE